MRRLPSILARLALGLLVLALVGAAGLLWVVHRYSEDLPDYGRLADYAPPTVTRVHAGDGRLLAEYARERRVFVPVEAIPERVRHAFIAAEDQNFYSHPGVDPVGILRAAVDNIRRLQDNRRPQGASTITQQVAKNFLLTNELSLDRKIKEAILALRIERAFSKDHILELYLNEIFLGARSYGVAAAALNYFNKSLDQLSLSEAAFLGGLPKAPSRYDPTRNHDAAVARRDYVIGRMLDDGYITAEEAREARAEPLVERARAPEEYVSADFFTEEVRRQLVRHFGEEGFYEGGLSVRTTVAPPMQAIADRALRRGLFDYAKGEGWRGPLGRIESDDPQTRLAQLGSFDPGFELFHWQLAVVLAAGEKGATIALADGSTGRIPLSEMSWARAAREGGGLGPAVKSAAQVASPGDVIVVEKLAEDRYGLRQRPQVEGAVVALDPHTGRVLALSGGFSYRQSQFNRATQALRQPGSAFKPFVYLAGLEAGMTPSTVILDAPLAIEQGPGLPLWRPSNYSDRFYGPTTLRVGLEKSRNVMTVRLAQEAGMERVIDVARRFGIDRGLQPFLAAALGSNEVTPLQLATAYAMLVNGGRELEPYLVERIQDRHGRTVMRRDQRACEACRAESWQEGLLPPELPEERPLVVDPRHAFQMVNMLQGVIDRGTGAAARQPGRPLGGKSGTTNEAKDAWFVGFSPDLVVAVFVGYDQPKSLGSRATGSGVALPIWKDVMLEALDGVPPQPFRTPPNVRIVQVDASTGMLPDGSTDKVISEAFLPGTEPVRSGPATAEGGDGRTGRPAMPGGGGIY
ncbi:penicillin-binding protein 1A [Geminicoccaceae bacterium 1502E]|nr:penicillin-binding protein 1A [Geminicoccaceae bacterium 1502E]